MPADVRRDLLEQLNDGQRLLLCALADLEEEAGDPARAKGWRWLAERGRWPVQVGDRWEWWRRREDSRPYNCSLPRLLMDHVRKLAGTPKGETCSFESASQALGCAARCVSHLLALYPTIDDEPQEVDTHAADPER